MTNPGLLPPRDTVQCFLYQNLRSQNGPTFLAPQQKSRAFAQKGHQSEPPRKGEGFVLCFAKDAVTR